MNIKRGLKRAMRFNNLEAEFARMGLSVDEVGQQLGFSRAILYNRLNCRTNWTLGDMLKILKFVNAKTNSNYTLDYLFARG